MPSDVGYSPKPDSIPPPLQSPSKSRREQSKLKTSGVDAGEIVTLLSATPSVTIESADLTTAMSDDGQPDRHSTIFMTETGVLDAIDEEEGEEDESPAPLPDDLYSSLGEEDSLSGDTSLSGDEEPDADYDTDLELDNQQKWLNPGLFDYDSTEVNRYIRVCEDLNIQPITHFVKHMRDTQLIMKYHGLGPLGVKAMSSPLEINTTIERMDLEGNFILGTGTSYLTKVLKDNIYVSELILSENMMGNSGAKAVCELLQENKCITLVDLKGNGIDDGVAEDIYNMLTKNTDLKTLNLQHNGFEDTGAKLIKDAISENDTLESLDLSWNHFQWRGCCSIAEGVQENVALKYLNFRMNGIGRQAAGAWEEALRQNHSLLQLDISYCRIPLDGAAHIAAGIQHNECLLRLNIGYNALQGEGGHVILMGAERNESETIKHLDFGNLMVKKGFKELAETLEEERDMTVLYGGVLLDVPRFRNANYDPWTAHLADPMTKLREWLDKTGYRLVDLLLTFDRDRSLKIDIEELKAGIKAAQIDLSDAEIESLFKQLDLDGSGDIDMRELMEGTEQNTLAEKEAEKFKVEQGMIDTERRRSSVAVGELVDITRT